MKRRLDRVTKECKRHGMVEHVLVPDPWKRKDGTITPSFYTSCMKCRVQATLRWKLSHPEAVAIANRKKRTRHFNRETRKAYVAMRRARFGDEARAYARAWCRKNPEKCARYRRTRRGRRMGQDDGSVERYWPLLLAAYDSRCAYCGKRCRPEQDHILPLSRGGAHSIRNIAPCCLSCNRKKNAHGRWHPRPWAAALPPEAA